MLRWVTPIRHFMRTAAADYAAARPGRASAGDDLFLAYPSANRDEAVYPDPFAFRVDRGPEPAPLLRLRRACLPGHGAGEDGGPGLLPRAAAAAGAASSWSGEPAWVGTNFVQGMKRMPVRFKLRADA